MASMSEQRRTLLFSATMTESLIALEELVNGNNEIVRFDLTSGGQKIPTTLQQEYILIPGMIIFTSILLL